MVDFIRDSSPGRNISVTLPGKKSCNGFYSLVRRTLLHLYRVVLVIILLRIGGEINLDRPPFRKCGRGKFQAQNGKLSEI